MMITESSTRLISKTFPYYLPLTKNPRNFRNTVTVFAKNGNLGDHLSEKQKPSFKIRFFSKPFLAQSAVAVFGLGFIDAGYSGDWSRIGVISKETEDLLKFLATIVVPLCIYIIFSLSSKDDA